ncbi:hypothetical protein Tco_0459271, partial [Tanacetum coccineum]
IATVIIIDCQLPFEYTIASRSTDVMVVDVSYFPCSTCRFQVLAQWNAVYDAHNEVACIMLESMTLELHGQLKNSSPYEKLQELKSMFEKQAGVERRSLGHGVQKGYIGFKCNVFQEVIKHELLLISDIIISDSEHSTVAYTSVSILVEDDSDMGTPGVDGPTSPDYVPGPEEPEQAPPSPVYLPNVPEPVYPEYIPPEDDVFLAEEQPLPATTSPTADSPGYIPEFDPERDPEEDDEEDPKEDPADRRDDDDNDDDDEEEDEEEEEHLAPADYTVVALPVVDHIPSPPLPIPSPPPNSPTHIEVPESCLPLRKRLRFAAPTLNHEVGESSAAGAARQDGPTVAREDPYSIARGDLYRFVDRVDVTFGRPMSRELDYGITNTWDDLVGAIEEIAPTTLEGVNQRVTNLSITVEDRPVHRRLAVMIEREAKMAREAWGLSMDASDYARSDVMSLRTTVVAQSALISELQSADHRRQRVISELLASDHKRQVQLTKTLRLLKGLQTQMVEFQRQHGPAKGPAQPDAPGEAGSSS